MRREVFGLCLRVFSSRCCFLPTIIVPSRISWRPSVRRTIVISLSMILAVTSIRSQQVPVFQLPSHPTEGERISQLFRHHYHEPTVRGAATLWDMWLAGASLWYGGDTPAEAETMRNYWRERLLTRPIDAEGYVGTCQHLGSAHSDGWPFPLWTQAEGVGWHFTLAHNPFLAGMNTPQTTSLDGWTLDGCSVVSIDPSQGLVLSLDKQNATLTSPAFDIDSYVSPFVCLDFAADGLAAEDAPSLAWDGGQGFQPTQEVSFAFPKPSEGAKLVMIPMHRHPKYSGRFKRWQIRWNNSRPAKVTIRAMHSAVDSRHNINNASFILGAIDYARWTADRNFVREILPKIWTALDYALQEFHVREEGVVRTDWIGHDGRTGLDRSTQPKKLVRGRGIGSNYWDLLPFGSRDFMATLYLLAAIDRTASLHRQIESHPEWNLPQPPKRLQAATLESLAETVRRSARGIFWNDTTGRFAACVDADSFLHDYGYVYLNAEAIHYGVATSSQARQIYQWIDGQRTVLGDTSQGSDIYHFRFAPRATTKRNIDWYMFAWSDPESIAWGGQVQDGGAVLAWSYHDIMSRLAVLGPDIAWKRLLDIGRWYDDVQKEGGYRAYYSKPERGTLQGCGTPGGLGIDCEFSESLLVPMAIVEGLAGFDPSLEGLRFSPKLSDEVPALHIHGLSVHGHVVDVKMTQDEVTFTAVRPAASTLTIIPPDPTWRVDSPSSPTSNRFPWQPRDHATLVWRKTSGADRN
jgi:hypothetical protein